MFSIRLISVPVDYPLLESWWRGHGEDPVPAGLLPRLGVIAEAGGQPVAACWLSMDNSVGFGALLWPTIKPGTPARTGAAALGHAIAFLKQEAARLGYRHLFAGVAHRGLISLLRRHGFTVTSRHVSHLIACPS